MPDIHVNGVRLHYTDQGQGPETIVFAHGLLWSGEMFREQIKALEDRYRCITFDLRGQGQSEVAADGYEIDTLYEDAVALIEQLEVAPCHFVGLSMGGFVGQRIAARRPDMLKTLMLLETSADPEPEENIPRYKMLAFIARWLGLRLVANQVMPIMFGQTFLNDPARTALREEWKQRMIQNHPVGIYRATMGVVNRPGVYEEISHIKCPTLIIVGDEDVATVPAKAERMHAQIPDSQLVKIPGAGHTSTLEEPGAVTATMEAFLNSH